MHLALFFIYEFIVISMCVTKISIASSSQHQFNSVFINIHHLTAWTFFIYSAAFGPYQRQSHPLFLDSMKGRYLARIMLISQMDWIFWQAHRVLAICYDIKGPQILSNSTKQKQVRIHILSDSTKQKQLRIHILHPFPLSSMQISCAEDPMLRQCPLTYKWWHLCSSENALRCLCSLREIASTSGSWTMKQK